MRLQRDSQRSRVYKWERQFWQKQKVMALDEVRKVVEQVGAHYGYRPVKVSDGRGRRRPCWNEYEDTIKLPCWARTQWVVLHEVAHWITGRQFDESVASHGPEFMGVLMHLAIEFGGHTLKELAASATEAGVRFRITGQSKPRKRLTA